MSTTVTHIQTQAPTEKTSDAANDGASNDGKVLGVRNGSTEHVAAGQSHDPAETEAERQDADHITGWRLVAITISLLLSIFLASLDLTIIATAIPSITDQFQSLDQVGWYASALFLTVAATQSFWGKAFKFFPLKIVYLVAILIFELGSLLCGVAPNSPTLIAGRAITGFGVAGYLAGSYIIIGVCAPEKHRPALTALMGSAYSIASVVGPLVGGALTDRVTWRWCFYINLPCGAVAGAFVFLFLRIPKAAKPAQATWTEKLRQMDITGVILVTAAVVCYLFALQWGGVSKNWGSADVVGTLVGFTSLLTLFFVHEWWEGERSLLLPSIMKNRTILSGCIFSFFIAGHFYILLYYLPIYFQAVRGASATASGVRSLPLILGLTLTQIIMGVTVGATRSFNAFLIVGSVLATIGSGLLTLIRTDSNHSAWIGYQALAGIGLGLCLTTPIIVTQRICTQENIAPATAVILFFQSLGGAIIVSAGQSVFQNELIKALPYTSPNLDPKAVLAVGVTEIRNVFPLEELPGIYDAYMKGIRLAFACSIPMAGVAALVAISQPWFKLPKEQNE